MGLLILQVVVALQILKPLMLPLKKHFHTTPSEYRKQAKELGRKTKLHDWKEIISTQEEDIVELLQSCLPYEHDSSYKLKLEEANQKLQVVREQLESVVKKITILTLISTAIVNCYNFMVLRFKFREIYNH